MRWTSASRATSPATAKASPPAFLTSATVSSAAALLISPTTTRAPSSAKRSEASRPMPIPAPVMSTIFPLSLDPIPSLLRALGSRPPHPQPASPCPLPLRGRGFETPSPLWGEGRGEGLKSCALDALEMADELPVGHRLVEGLLLEPPMLKVMLDHLVAERLARHPRAPELVERLPERLGDLRQRRVFVGIALVDLGRLELLLDAVQPRRDGGGEGQVRIGVGTGDAVLDAKARVLAAEPEAAGPVVPAAGDSRRREGARLVALVGIDGGRVEVGELARHGYLSR